MTKQNVGVKWTTGDVINEVETTVDDVNREMQIYSSQLFQQAEWEAELMKLDLPASQSLELAARAVKASERAVTTIDDLEPSIKGAVEATTQAAEGATKLTSEMPAVVASERKAAIAAINEDLQKTLTFVDRERLASFDQISRERIAIQQQLDAERAAAVADLREVATKERVAFSRDIEQSGLRIVDHAASRLLRLAAFILGFLFLAAVLFLFIIRRLFFSSQPRQWAGNPPRAA